MSDMHLLKNEIYEQNEEIFNLTNESEKIYSVLLKSFNVKNVKLVDAPAHKRIFLFFLARVIKTCSAIRTLCREGYGQDASPLLRSLLEMLITVQYIIYKPEEADKKAVRFVDYKWVILKRYLGELEREATAEDVEDLLPNRSMIGGKFQEFKQKYQINSDRHLLTWSGKPTRDMARMGDKELLKEYDLAFRVDSRFSHPSIMGDKEYLEYEQDALVFSYTPSASGVVLSLKRATNYLVGFLCIFDSLFTLGESERLRNFQSRTTEVFRMKKYENVLNSEKSLPHLNKEMAEKMHVKFKLS